MAELEITTERRLMSPKQLALFFAKVNQDGPIPDYAPHLGPCWIWTAALSVGYGHFWNGSEVKGAHVMSYEHFVAVLEPGFEPDHLCRVRSCVRWSHLEAVTRRTNSLRGMNPTAITHRTGLCKYGHSMADAYIQPSNGGRRCRTCMWEWNEARRGRGPKAQMSSANG
jgi:hypothetical protein